MDERLPVVRPEDGSVDGSAEVELSASEQIRLFVEYLQQLQADVLEQARKGERFLILNFGPLAEFNPRLADLVLDHPEDAIKAAEKAIEQVAPAGQNKGFIVRFKGLPASNSLLVRNIRSKDLGRLIWTEGVVRNKTDIRPQVVSARFECPSCGNTIPILQVDQKFKEPSRCSCGRQGKFRLVSKELVDAQKLVLEEIPEQLEGGVQPKRLDILLKNDLTSPITERRTNPGSRVIVSGIIKEVPIFTRTGAPTTRFDILMECNWLEPVEEDFTDIRISPEEEKTILELAEDPKLMKHLVASIAPSIYGHEKVKEGLVLQLAGGVRKVRKDGVVTRGDMHILLLGDPGSAKSQMLKRATKVAPKSRYVTGKGASGAGLSATVVKDEFLQGWSLEAGALVLANKGLCCIDELDKMSKEDAWAMHEALEQQTVSISKANVQAVLHCETTVLAAANPKYGRFDPYELIAKQIELPVTLINRFDLIFPIKDIPDEGKDEKMAKFILEIHQQNVGAPPVETNLLRKYFAYARQRVKPQLTDAAIEELKNYYVRMRSSGSKEAGVKSIPITARQLEGLVRLSEASARVRLSDKVQRKDAQRAIELLDYCLRQTAFDEKTGTIDIDRIATTTSASQRNKIILMKEIISELEGKLSTKTIPLENVLQAAGEKGISDEEADEIIQRLKRSGDLYEPRRGFVQRV